MSILVCRISLAHTDLCYRLLGPKFAIHPVYIRRIPTGWIYKFRPLYNYLSIYAEHQPTTWFSFFFDLHVLACVFPVGLWYCIKNVNDERVFIILYAVSAVYFAGVMVR